MLDRKDWEWYNNVMQNNNVIPKHKKTRDGGQPGGLRQKQKDQIRMTVLEAASKIVAREGTEALSLRKVAEQVGASTMVVYTAFGSKDGLIQALWQEGFRRLWTLEEDALKEQNPVLRLKGLGQAYRKNALNNPYFYRLVFDGRLTESETPDNTAVRNNDCSPDSKRTFEVLIETVFDCQQAGQMTTKFSASDIAAMFWSTAHGAISLELAGMLSCWADPDKIFAQNFDNLMVALKP